MATQVDEEIPLSPAEQVVSDLHDRLVLGGAGQAQAARAIRRSLAVRATAVQLDEDFWSWLEG